MSAHEDERLSAYLDGELPSAERAEVEAHLAACEECTALLGQMGAVDDVARKVRVEAPPGYFDSFPDRVRARIQRETSSRPRRARAHPAWRLPAWTWAAAAALVLAVVTPLTLPSLFRAGVPSRERPLTATPMEETTLRAPEAAAEHDVIAGDDEQAARRPFQRDAGRSGRAPQTEAAPESVFVPPPPAAPAPQPHARSGRTDATAGAAPPPTDERLRELRKDAPALASVPPPVAAQGERHQEAPPPSEPEEVRREETTADTMAPGARAVTRESAAFRGATVAPESAETRPEGLAVAERKAVRDEGSVAFVRLAREVPADAAGWRESREAWRDFLATHPGSQHADEARVRVIEAGLEAWRAGGDPEDLTRARADAAAYLARDDARLKPRVRRALEESDTR